MERKETFLILKQYYKNNSYINLLLKSKDIDSSKMSAITIRVYGILQNKEYIDYLISKLILKDKIDINVRIIMEIAVYDFIFLNKPIHVCVNESVELAKVYAKSASGYINVKLRDLDQIKNLEINFIKEEKNLEIKYSHPRWIVKLLMKQYPDDYEKILKSNTMKKDITVRKLNDFTNPEFFENIEIKGFESDLYKFNDKSIVSTNDFKSNNIVIQDVGSYLVGKMVAPQRNEIILDLCAAPGNKTMQISKNAALVVANEINVKRYELLNSNLLKYNIDNVETINADASKKENIIMALKEQNLPLQYDKILIDAPCSGLGVIKSKPEIKYNMNISEIEKIIDIQSNILENAYDLLKVGGQLIYSTCTINKEENEKQILKLLAENKKFTIIENDKLKTYMQDKSEVGITLKPYVFNSDGFYIVKLEKNE